MYIFLTLFLHSKSTTPVYRILWSTSQSKANTKMASCSFLIILDKYDLALLNMTYIQSANFPQPSYLVSNLHNTITLCIDALPHSERGVYQMLRSAYQESFPMFIAIVVIVVYLSNSVFVHYAPLLANVVQLLALSVDGGFDNPPG